MARSESPSRAERPNAHSQFEALELVYSEGLFVWGAKVAEQLPRRPYTGAWSVSRHKNPPHSGAIVGTGRDLMEAVRDLLAQERGEVGRSARLKQAEPAPDPAGEELM